MENDEMKDSIIELKEKINGLEKLYDQMVQTVTHNIDMFWMLLFGVLSIMGIALFFVAKQIVNNKVGSEIEKIKSDLNKRQNEYQSKIIQQDKLITGFKEKITELENKINLGSVSVFHGSGSPEGSVTAHPGTVFIRKDGNESERLYVKEFGSGNVGWIATGRK